MRGSKAKRIRRMIRAFQAGPDQLMGDNRTVRYFWRRPDGLIEKSGMDTPPVDGATPIFATYTLRYHPGSMRSIYRRVKANVQAR